MSNHNDVGSTNSVILRHLTSLSGTKLRRKILNAFRCGGSHRIQKQTANTFDKPISAVKSRRSEKLYELLNMTDGWELEVETNRKVEVFSELKGVIKKLQSEEEDLNVEGSKMVRKLTKEDSEARCNLSMMGAIPPLVRMIDSGDVDFVVESLYALLNLGIGNDVNKAAIVKAGAVHKMLKLIESPERRLNKTVTEAVVVNFLGLSALDSNKPIIGSSGAIPLLVNILMSFGSKSSLQARHDTLRALYNLSICHSNVSEIIETDLIPFLIDSLGDTEVSERILMVLSNVVSTPEGRRNVSLVDDVFLILVDILNWTDMPGCQEKASYVLMVMAHKAYGDRQAMVDAGIISALLELTLLGTTLAQKRASRILECLTVNKGKEVYESYCVSNGGAVSAPICGSSSSYVKLDDCSTESLKEEESMMSEERKAVKQLVQQSLQNNMRRIVKRANLPQNFIPSEHLKSLTSSSTSKSLPF